MQASDQLCKQHQKNPIEALTKHRKENLTKNQLFNPKEALVWFDEGNGLCTFVDGIFKDYESCQARALRQVHEAEEEENMNQMWDEVEEIEKDRQEDRQNRRSTVKMDKFT